MTDFLIFTPFVLIALSYITYFLFGKKIIINPNVLNIIKYVNYLILSSGFLLFSMSLLGYYSSSIWTPKILAWIYLITGCFLLINSLHNKNRFEKIYNKILFYSPSVLIAGWIIPMLGLWICYSFSLLFYTDESKIIFNDKNYMLKFEEGFFVYDHDPTLFKKHGVIMKKLKDIELNNWNFEKKIEIIDVYEAVVQIKYFNENALEMDTLIKL